MTPNRWTLAQDTDALTLPDGPVLVLRARADASFETLGQVQAIQGFYPDHAQLAARGVDVRLTPEGPFAVALVQIVKSKVETLALLAEAVAQLPPGGLILVDGQKQEGIASVLKTVKALFKIDDVMSKSHGKLFWFTRPEILPDGFSDWHAIPTRLPEGFVTAPGAFSADAIDIGSELLATMMPPLKGRVADLGAGWGYLAAAALKHEAVTQVDLIEAEHAALEAARINITDPRAQFIWDDATRFKTETRYDFVISNPPFHTGTKAEPALGVAFIEAAARLLKPSGQFVMVANRHLPYEAALKSVFGTGQMLAETHGYKLYQAAKPKRAKA
jgi:16S rRNA (guanine1207-N2)-methyltransferase